MKGRIAAPPKRLRFLIISHRGMRCGVQQFGRRLLQLLSLSPDIDWRYAECASIDDFLGECRDIAPAAVLFNLHEGTMPWAAGHGIRACGVPCLAVVHEAYQLTPERLERTPFDGFLYPDPSFVPASPLVFPVPRFTPPIRPAAPAPKLFTVGWFGFASPGKGLDRLCSRVNEEFDTARIRMNLSPHDRSELFPEQATQSIIADCRRMIRKPGIVLDITRDFLDEDRLLDFLSENTVNAFLYDDLSGPDRGISSCLDYALAAGRPMAVSGSRMFRHVHGINPSIRADRRSLRDIAASGLAPLAHHIARYEPGTSSAAWNGAVLEALDRLEARRSVPGGRGYNKLLSPAPQAGYPKRVACGTAARGPNAGSQKAPARRARRVDVQQSFVIDAVERLAADFFEPRILGIGSPDDVCIEALRVKGYVLDLIDLQEGDLAPLRKGAAVHDIVFCTTTLNRMAEDEAFIREVADRLAPGGVAVLPLDIGHPDSSAGSTGEEHPATGVACPTEHRLYTPQDIFGRLLPLLPDCIMFDPPQWDSGDGRETGDQAARSIPASWVFRKFDAERLRYAMPGPAGHHVPAETRHLARLQNLQVQGHLHMGLRSQGIAGFDDDERIFSIPVERPGFLLFGPYVPMEAGTYCCSFLLRLETTGLPDDTVVALIDTAFDGTAQEQIHGLTAGELEPGAFVPVTARFAVPRPVAAFEVRVRTVHPVAMSIVAAVAIGQDPPCGGPTLGAAG